MKVKAPRGYHFMKKKGKFKLMKNPKGGYKKHKGSSLTMNVPLVKRHSKWKTKVYITKPTEQGKAMCHDLWVYLKKNTKSVGKRFLEKRKRIRSNVGFI